MESVAVAVALGTVSDAPCALTPSISSPVVDSLAVLPEPLLPIEAVCPSRTPVLPAEILSVTVFVLILSLLDSVGLALLTELPLPGDELGDSETPVLSDEMESVVTVARTISWSAGVIVSASLGAAVDFVASTLVPAGIKFKLVGTAPAEMTVVSATRVWMLVYVV